jgi:hypothetical protein
MGLPLYAGLSPEQLFPPGLHGQTLVDQNEVAGLYERSTAGLECRIQRTALPHSVPIRLLVPDHDLRR